MKAYSFNETLKKVTEEVGISLETLSLCSGVPIALLTDPLFAAKKENLNKANDLLLIMMLIINSPVGKENEYVISHIISLESHFKISRNTIAHYANVSIEELNTYLNNNPDQISDKRKYQIVTAVLHLFSVLTRRASI